jgi:hypothetical protein
MNHVTKTRCCAWCAEEELKPGIGLAEPCGTRAHHKMVPWEMWVSIGTTQLYDVRSVRTAIRCFEESCGGLIETARKLTREEYEAVLNGEATFEIAVVKVGRK